jgi:hypothetical protein
VNRSQTPPAVLTNSKSTSRILAVDGNPRVRILGVERARSLGAGS